MHVAGAITAGLSLELLTHREVCCHFSCEVSVLLP